MSLILRVNLRVLIPALRVGDFPLPALVEPPAENRGGIRVEVQERPAPLLAAALARSGEPGAVTCAAGGAGGHSVAAEGHGGVARIGG